MQHTAETTRAANLLGTLIKTGTLDSRLDTWLDDMRSAKEGFYTKTLINSGREAAERELQEWVANRHADEMASATRNVAAALMELAKFDEKRRRLNKDPKKSDKPMVRIYDIDRSVRVADSRFENGLLIIADNPHVPGCGCSQPKGSSVFGRGGALGLRSIGICVDEYKQKAELILLFPHPEFRTGNSLDTMRGYASVTVDTKGFASGTAVKYYLYNNAIDFTLGDVTAEKLIGGSTTMSDIEVALQFPDADKYLSSRIAQLPEYLTAAVAKLSGSHTH